MSDNAPSLTQHARHIARKNIRYAPGESVGKGFHAQNPFSTVRFYPTICCVRTSALQQLTQTPVLIGVILTDCKRFSVEAAKYLILEQNRVQKTFDFAVFDLSDQRLNNSNVPQDGETYLDRTRGMFS